MSARIAIVARPCRLWLTVILLLLPLGLSSCGSSLYYKAQEKIGNEKRDILADRVRKSRKEQEEAKQQFQTTLEAFQSVTGFEGGKTEEVYKKLKKEYDDAQGRADKVSNRIASIEQVAKDLFSEWDKEIDQMGSRDLRTKSAALLRDTQTRYATFIKKMKEVDARGKPVLRAFQDQVLFIKHNLNAEAIRSLKKTAVQMDGEVARLIQDIEVSMQEADAFLSTLPNANS